MYCSVLQYAAVCCSVLQCVAVTLLKDVLSRRENHSFLSIFLSLSIMVLCVDGRIVRNDFFCEWKGSVQ